MAEDSARQSGSAPSQQSDDGDPPDELDIELLSPSEGQPTEEDGPSESPPARAANAPAAARQAAPAEPTDDRLVVELDDLWDLDDAPRAASPGFPPLPLEEHASAAPSPVGTRKIKGGVGGSIVKSLLLQMLIAGAIGGLLAWAVAEPGARRDDLSGGPEPVFRCLAEMAVYGAIIGGSVACVLCAAEGVVTAAWLRALAGGALGAVIGAAGGGTGGLVAQIVYSLLGGGMAAPDASILRQIVARALGWAVLGGAVGLCPGLVAVAGRRVLNGLLGGLAGGFVGGFLFDLVGALFAASSTAAGTPSRFVGLLLTGACTGLGVGLVEEVLKQAWILVCGGPLSGKQFIIYNQSTWVGSSPGADVPLVKDRDVAPKHLVIERSGGTHVLRSAGGAALVNGVPVGVHRLADGDVIHLGATVLQYRTKLAGTRDQSESLPGPLRGQVPGPL